MCSGSVTWQGATTTCMHEGLQETGCGYQHHQLSGVTKSLDETPTEIQEAEAITSLHVRASAHAFPGMAPISDLRDVLLSPLPAPLLQDPAGWSAYPVVVQRSSGGGHHAARSTQPWWRAAHRRSPPVLGSGRTPLTTTGGASAPRFQPGYRGAMWEPAGERSEAGHTFLPPRPHLSAESRQPILPSVPAFYWGDSWS